MDLRIVCLAHGSTLDVFLNVFISSYKYNEKVPGRPNIVRVKT
jgi:hypothetical protein